MLNRVASYIKRHQLLERQSLYLIALSGGADSVCLLLVMRELGYNVHAVHCNFNLRGEESDRDESFCRDLCSRLSVEFHFTHFDTRSYAKLYKVSVEMAARELRYAYFEQLRQAIDATAILVAHHRDDNVETFLMNVLRGTGIHGLEGIKPRNRRIIRPLLCVSREDIEQYLAVHAQDYVTDSTNLVDDVVRNKIRLNVIPLLKNINPSVVENISRTIDNVSEIAHIADDAIDKHIKNCTRNDGDIVCIDIKQLANTPSPEQILFSILSPLHFSSQQILNIYNGLKAQPGKVWTSASHTIVMDRQTLLVASNDYVAKTPEPLKIPEEGIYIYNVRNKIGVTSEKRASDFSPSKSQYVITLDAGMVKFPLTVRPVAAGDRFIPFGMKGAKLVNDYLTDRKRNYFQRQRQLVVADGNGNIVWVVGERTSQLVACTDKTINVLTLRYITDD